MTIGKGRWTVLGCVGCALAATAAALAMMAASAGPAAGADGEKPDPALERAREQVKMLDDLYKNAVVSTTQLYNGPPAIRMAKQVFGAMEKKGWHSARLVDASGAPMSETSLPATDFEKRAAAAMQEGKPYYEEVVGNGADRRLYAATVVPAVLKKCATCHGAKEGDLLGFIRYDLPVK
jgi:hypothetical protein